MDIGRSLDLSQMTQPSNTRLLSRMVARPLGAEVKGAGWIAESRVGMARTLSLKFDPFGRHAAVRPAGAHVRRRARRVHFLLIGILLLSAGDLALTLGHLQTTGMAEANPIAAFVIRSTDSAAGLVIFKSLTVAICVTLLYCFRRHRAGEIAAWCGLAILAAMSVMWHAYSTSMESPAAIRLVQASYGDDWLTLD